MTVHRSFKIPEGDIDDLLYYARVGETEDLLVGIDRIKTQFNKTVMDVLLAVQDAQSGNTVLHMAAANGYLGTFNLKLILQGINQEYLETTKQILSLLQISRGLDSTPHVFVSSKNIAGNTALHWASLNGHLEVVKALILEANADPTLTNLAGHDAIYEAEFNDKKDVVEWVLRHCEYIEKALSKEGSHADLDDPAKVIKGVVMGIEKQAI